MNISRRSFLGAAGAAGAAIALPGCCCCSCCGGKAQVALQLYSIRTYIGGKKDKDGKELVKGKGLAQALKDVAAIGYKGVEFAGYYGHKPEELKAMLADAGLVVCGTHVANNMYGFDTKAGTFNPDKLKETCAFELAYGNSLIICPGGGNIPPGATWSTGRGGEPCKPSQAIDDFTKKLVELYNKGAEVAKGMGCKIGLHNHTWEHGVKMLDGTSFWDYFFTNTSQDVCMEQDVGWTTCAGDMFPGLNAVEQYKKYPGPRQGERHGQGRQEVRRHPRQAGLRRERQAVRDAGAVGRTLPGHRRRRREVVRGRVRAPRGHLRRHQAVVRLPPLEGPLLNSGAMFEQQR